jgi:hypothetical protein
VVLGFHIETREIFLDDFLIAHSEFIKIRPALLDERIFFHRKRLSAPEATSTVITARASASMSRSAMGCGPKPENKGIATAPILAIARNAAAASGIIGM